MGAAHDIKQVLTKNLATFTKQRKAEEKHASAGRFRRTRMIEVRGEYLTEAANAVMVECYMKVSDNDRLPAKVRQIFYVARPLIEERTEKPLEYGYFSQTVLPNYIKHHPESAAWDVVYDDRGHFMEPHTKRVIGLGTLAVRNYVARVKPLQFEDADFAPAAIQTYGPNGCFGALLYIEKEGFFPLFEKVKLAERYDIGIMSSKGMSVTAARQLADSICGRFGIPLLVLHDFDRPGIIIKDTLENDTRRYSYTHALNVIDLGLRHEDIGGLAPEPHDSNVTDARLCQAGVGQDAIEFLRDQKVELNAMTSRQLVDFVEAKLQQHGIKKVVPDRETLAKTFKMFAASDRLAEAFDDMKKNLEDEGEAPPVEVPDGLEATVKAKLEEKPDITWHHALRLIVDPDAPASENEEEDDSELDDQDLSDIDE
jgi:hypothetical protein